MRRFGPLALAAATVLLTLADAAWWQHRADPPRVVPRPRLQPEQPATAAPGNAPQSPQQPDEISIMLVQNYVRWLSDLDEQRSRAQAVIPDPLRQNEPQTYYLRCLADTSAFHERFLRCPLNRPPQCARLRNYYDSGLSALEGAQREALAALRAGSAVPGEEADRAFRRARDLLCEAGNEMQSLCAHNGMTNLRIHY